MATTKEPAPLQSIQGDTVVAQNPGGQAPPQTGAVGIEIPVVVHASRSSVGAREPLPPLHEKTQTAIVFSKGGVVRLSANLSVGELVVLTNQQSGADVLCRVNSIKAHPGSQNYVGLEFTQHAPDFWGQCFATPLPSQTEHPWSEPALPIVATVPPIPASVRQLATPSPSNATPVALIPAATAPPALAAVPVSAARVQSPGPSFEPAVAPLSSANDWGAIADQAHSSELEQQPATNSQKVRAEQRSPILNKGLWAIPAAVVVVALTITGSFVGRHGQFNAPVEKLAVASPIAPTEPTAVTPTADQSIQPAAASEAVPDLSATSLELPPAPERTENESGTSSQQLSRRSPIITAGRLVGPIVKPPVRTTSSEPPEVPQTQGNSLTENMLGTGSIAGNRADVPAPPISLAANSAPRADRPLQMPQLVSSSPLNYPPSARRMNIEGVVVLDALVDGTGKVTDVKVASGPITLQQAAIDAVRSSRYEPARLNGQPVAEHIKVNLDFRLNPPVASASSEVRAPATLAQGTSAMAPLSSAVSEAPRAISSPPPRYPAQARAQNIEGTVTVDILVDATGKVAQAKVISGAVQLQPAALEAVRYWTYQPARKDGQPIAQHIQVSINFRIH